MPSLSDLGSGRYAKRNFRHTADVADALTWIVLLGFSVLLMAAAVWGQKQLADPNTLAARNGVTVNQLWTTAIVSLVLFYAVVAPLVMLGMWLASLIFKFDLPGGAYLRSAAVAAVPAVLILGYSLAIAAEVLPDNRVVTSLVIALSLPLAALLAKASFGMSVPETLVAALIVTPLGLLGAAIDSAVVKAAVAAGNQTTNRSLAIAPPAPSPAIVPQPSPTFPPLTEIAPPTASRSTITEPYIALSPAERDKELVDRLQVDVASLVDSEITPNRLSFLHSRLDSLRTRLQALLSHAADGAALKTIGDQLDVFEAQLSAPPPTNTAPPAQEAMVVPKIPPSATPAPPDGVAASTIDSALQQLDDPNVFKQKAALESLAMIPAERNRPEVTRRLETLILADSLATRDPATAALANWADGLTVVKLLPWLDENSPTWHVEPAIKILAATKDKRAVLPIVRWIIKKPENVVPALTLMGPVAEDEVIKLLREPDGEVRKNAARILQEIGGQKSLIPLQRAAGDSRDPTAQQAGKIALEIVRERFKQSHATTKPA